MKLAFDVGETEKHRVEFSWNQFWGTSWIAIDGRKVQTSGVRLSSPAKIIGKTDAPSGWKARVLHKRCDGSKLLPYQYDYLDIQLVERWTVPVGTNEKHQVVIEKERERWCAAIRPQKYRVHIDDALVKECRGY
jgi:hypothetical protein